MVILILSLAILQKDLQKYKIFVLLKKYLAINPHEHYRFTVSRAKKISGGAGAMAHVFLRRMRLE